MRFFPLLRTLFAFALAMVWPAGFNWLVARGGLRGRHHDHLIAGHPPRFRSA